MIQILDKIHSSHASKLLLVICTLFNGLDQEQVRESVSDGPVGAVSINGSIFWVVLTSCVFRQQWYGEILFSLLLQTSPPLQLVLLGGFGDCLQLMLPQ